MNKERALLDRRAFLGWSIAGAVVASSPGAALAQQSGTFFARYGVPIGLQLYTVTEAARQDLEGTLKKIASIGYQTIELAGLHGHEPAELRAIANRLGLRYTAMHVQPVSRGSEPALDGDIARLADVARKLGVTDLVMPIFLIPENAPKQNAGEGFGAYLGRVGPQFTIDDWKRNADFLNKKGAALKREGLKLGYHNHNPEFAPVGKTTGFDVIVRETDPDLVTIELDVGWVAAAGVDPVAVLKRYPKRFTLMHVKDVRSTTKSNYTLNMDPTEVGSGTVNWKQLLPAAYEAGVRKFFVEQEPPFTTDRFEAIAKSYAYLTSAS